MRKTKSQKTQSAHACKLNSSLGTLWIVKQPMLLQAESKNSDQTASVDSEYSDQTRIGGQRILRSDDASAPSDLRFRWPHM